MATRGAQGRESTGEPTPEKLELGEGRTDPHSEPKPVAGVRRVSEQRKSQNCQHQQILPGLETLEEGLGDFIKEKLTHTWRSRHLSQESSAQLPNALRKLSGLASFSQDWVECPYICADRAQRCHRRAVPVLICQGCRSQAPQAERPPQQARAAHSLEAGGRGQGVGRAGFF